MAWGAPRGVDDLITKLKDNKTVRRRAACCLLLLCSLTGLSFSTSSCGSNELLSTSVPGTAVQNHFTVRLRRTVALYIFGIIALHLSRFLPLSPMQLCY